MKNSIPNSLPNCNPEPPVIEFRYIPINWQDGTTSQIAIVNEPRRQSQVLEDRPIIIGGIATQFDAFSQAVPV